MIRITGDKSAIDPAKPVLIKNIPGSISINSLLTTKTLPPCASGNEIGTVTLFGKPGIPNLEATVVKSTNSVGTEDMYFIVSGDEVLATLKVEVLKKKEENSQGLFVYINKRGQESKMLNPIVGQKAGFLLLNHRGISGEHVDKYENLGEAFIQIIVEISLNEGCEGGIVMGSSNESSAAYYHYGFRSSHSDLSVREELDEVCKFNDKVLSGRANPGSERIDIYPFNHFDGSLSSCIQMYLPKDSIDEWRHKITAKAILKGFNNPNPPFYVPSQLRVIFDAMRPITN